MAATAATAGQWTVAIPSSRSKLTSLMSGAITMAAAHQPSTEAILMGGLLTSTMACGGRGGVSNNGGERAATPAAAVAAAAGRGGAEIPAGGNDV